MIKKTEIIYHNSTDEVIDSFDDLLNVKVGDKFYLALRVRVHVQNKNIIKKILELNRNFYKRS